MQDKKKKGTFSNFSAFYPVAAMFFIIGIVQASFVFISSGLFFLICAIDESGKHQKDTET